MKIKTKSMLDIVHELEASGHRISFRVRTDGGIIITKIDSQKVGITEGNRRARSMVTGGQLSAKRTTQTKYNVEHYIQGKKAKGFVSDELRQATKNVQKIQRKTGNYTSGRTSLKKVRWRIKHYGEQETLHYLNKRANYLRGYAYPENVEWLRERIARLQIGQTGSNYREIENILDYLEANKDTFLEKNISRVNEVCYDKTKSTEQKIQDIKRIIGIN